MAEITLNINGMSCQHCVMSVKKALNTIDGINSAEVSVGSAIINYDESLTNIDEISKAIQDAEYKLSH